MRLFDINIEPSCAYCRRGSDLGQGEIACIKRGIVSAGGFCKSFKYDPLKRVPNKIRTLDTSGFSEEDFSL